MLMIMEHLNMLSFWCLRLDQDSGLKRSGTYLNPSVNDLRRCYARRKFWHELLISWQVAADMARERRSKVDRPCQISNRSARDAL